VAAGHRLGAVPGAPSPDAPVAPRGVPWWADVAFVVVIFEIEALLAWYVPALDRPVWLATTIIAAVGLAALLLANLVRRRRHPVGARRVVSALVLALTAFTGYVAWSVTVPAKISDDTAAATVADRLLAGSATGVCEHRVADLASVGSLLTATSVCVFGTGSHRWVEFVGPSTAAPGVPGDHVRSGLLFTRSDHFGDMDLCLRHLEGRWWQYEGLILECPTGYTPIGGP
jgi:hypothetical protein